MLGLKHSQSKRAGVEGWSKQGAAVTRQHSSGLLLVLSCQGGTLDSGMSGVLWGVPEELLARKGPGMGFWE